jgi:hypothetical protein
MMTDGQRQPSGYDPATKPPVTVTKTGPGRVGDGKINEQPSRATGIWLYILGFFTGIFTTMIVTILFGWIVDSGFPHSSWINRAFYGYALGCSSIATGKDVAG